MHREIRVANALFHIGLLLMLGAGALSAGPLEDLGAAVALMGSGAVLALTGRLTLYWLRRGPGRVDLVGPAAGRHAPLQSRSLGGRSAA